MTNDGRISGNIFPKIVQPIEITIVAATIHCRDKNETIATANDIIKNIIEIIAIAFKILKFRLSALAADEACSEITNQSLYSPMQASQN